MKILLLTHEFTPFPGGIARYSVELARAAGRLGHEVHVVAPDHGAARASLDDAAEPFTVHRRPTGIYRTANLPAMMADLVRFLGRGRWDFVHAADHPYAIALSLYDRLKHLLFQCTVHGTDILALPSSRAARLLVNGDPFARAARIVCNSAFTRGLLHRTFPQLPEARTLVTHLGVGEYWFAPPTDADLRAVRERIGLAEGEKVVLTVARLEERKGHLLTLDALDLLWQRGVRGFRYVIVGLAAEAAYEQRLRERAGRAPFPVVFTGRLPENEVRAAYRTASVFCMPGLEIPGRVEGFGLAYLEAAAQGLPAIGVRINAVPEVVPDGRTGFLIGDASAAELSQVLEKLLADSPLHAEVSAAARAWAREFTWEKCAQKTFPDVPSAAGATSGLLPV